MEIIHTEQAPAAIGPYSQGYIMGGIVYTSGQIPVDPKTGAVRRGSPRRRSRAARMLPRCWKPPGRSWKTSLRPRASCAIWPILRPLMRYTRSISCRSPRAAASPCVSCRGACSARSRRLPQNKRFSLPCRKSSPLCNVGDRRR